MENNEILSRLMADGQPTSSTPTETAPVAAKPVDSDLSLSTARVVAVRYKVFSMVLLLVSALLLLYAILPSWDALSVVRGQLSAQKQTIQEFTAKKKIYEDNVAFINLIQKSESAISDCVNQRINCATLDTKIKDNFAFARSFLLLSDLHDAKMEVNEKTLLKNINEYLLGKSVSSVENISLGKSELVEGNLYSLPITLRVEFPDKDKLFAFIDRVDKQIPNTEAVRVLYKLDEVSYDIMNYNDVQTVDLSLQAFYYQQ